MRGGDFDGWIDGWTKIDLLWVVMLSFGIEERIFLRCFRRAFFARWVVDILVVVFWLFRICYVR